MTMKEALGNIAALSDPRSAPTGMRLLAAEYRGHANRVGEKDGQAASAPWRHAASRLDNAATSIEDYLRKHGWRV